MWTDVPFHGIIMGLFPTDLGLSVHQKTLDQCSAEKEVAVAAAEEAIWQQAEVIKEEALHRAHESAQKDHEKVVRKLSKAHEKAIRVSFVLC